MRRVLVLALVAVFVVAGCARFNPQESPVADAERLAANKKYSEAIGVYDRIAREKRGSAAGADALFASALATAFYDNPDKDYALALQKFEEFLRRYPSNEKARNARNWRSFLKMVLELKKENERLNRNIEELKQIDIRHEQQRKGR